MATPRNPRRKTLALGLVLLGCGLPGVGCGTSGPAPARERATASDVGGEPALRLFPTGAASRLAPEAVAILPKTGRRPGDRRDVPPLVASFPASRVGAPSRQIPGSKPSLRSARRLDGGATIVR